MCSNSPFGSSRLISVSLLILIVQFNVVVSNTPENCINAYFSWLFVLVSFQNFQHQNNSASFMQNISRQYFYSDYFTLKDTQIILKKKKKTCQETEKKERMHTCIHNISSTEKSKKMIFVVSRSTLCVLL